MKTNTGRRAQNAVELEDYLGEIDRVALLSREEEVELATRIAQGDLTARERMILANLRLVVHIAKGYVGRGLPLSDLIAEGNLGLMRAVEGYNVRVGVRFSTYASFWIKQAIRRSMQMHAKPIRLPHHAVSLLAKWGRVSAALAEQLGQAPEHEEVSRTLRLSKKKRDLVAQALKVNRLTARPGGSDEDEDPSLGLIDERTRAAEDALSEADERERVLAALDSLDRREATVLRLRFGLDSGAPMSGTEVGEVLGLTRSRIQQIEKEALRNLAAALGEPGRTDPVRPKDRGVMVPA